MMDFFVREVRAVVKGPICIVRFGSCGSIGDAKLGQIAVASKGAIMVQRNVDYFSSAIHDSSDCRRQVGESAYKLSKVFIPHPTLSETLYTALAKNIGAENVCSVLNVTADSFYSSQGRLDPHFRDENQDLIKTVKERYPDAGTLEMETFMVRDRRK